MAELCYGRLLLLHAAGNSRPRVLVRSHCSSDKQQLVLPVSARFIKYLCRVVSVIYVNRINMVCSKVIPCIWLEKLTTNMSVHHVQKNRYRSFRKLVF
jgi:hypothetical protein